MGQSQQKVSNRWLVVVGAVLIQLCLGAIYAWSVFTPYLTGKLQDPVTKFGSAILSMDTKFQSELDNNTISPDLRQEINSKGFSLSEKAKVNLLETRKKWQVVDEKNTLNIKLENDQLEVSTDLPETKTQIDTKFQSELDNNTISPDLKQEINSKGFSLSEKAKVNLLETGKKWQVVDEKNTLNIKLENNQLKLWTGFSKTQTQIVFAVGLAVFALVMIFAGKWQAKTGPRKVAITGGILLGAGYILAGFLGK